MQVGSITITSRGCKFSGMSVLSIRSLPTSESFKIMIIVPNIEYPSSCHATPSRRLGLYPMKLTSDGCISSKKFFINEIFSFLFLSRGDSIIALNKSCFDSFMTDCINFKSHTFQVETFELVIRCPKFVLCFYLHSLKHLFRDLNAPRLKLSFPRNNLLLKWAGIEVHGQCTLAKQLHFNSLAAASFSFKF